MMKIISSRQSSKSSEGLRKKTRRDETFRGSREQQSEGNTFTNIRLQNELSPPEIKTADQQENEGEEEARPQIVTIDDSKEEAERRQSQHGDKKTDDRSSNQDMFNLNLFRELEAEIQQAELNVQPAPVQYDVFMFRAPAPPDSMRIMSPTHN